MPTHCAIWYHPKKMHTPFRKAPAFVRPKCSRCGKQIFETRCDCTANKPCWGSRSETSSTSNSFNKSSSEKGNVFQDMKPSLGQQDMKKNNEKKEEKGMSKKKDDCVLM